MILKADYFTPLSQAVASIDRDSFAARFAVYDREHKAMLRRLAIADERCSAADLAREEQAFRDAIRRIEFADGDDQATLVPQGEPAAGEVPPEPKTDTVWPEPRPPRREARGASSVPSLDDFESAAVEPMLKLSEPRSVARRVGERLALAALVLVLGGAGLWMVDGRRGATTEPPSLHGAVESPQPAAADTADAKAPQPTWLSPEMFYAPPPMPSSAPPPRGEAPRR
ncbi:MAG TPA: hypothetical protein VGN55_07905 [Xanthobacteraceae bacterium]|jgi:hypothetical protein